MYSHLLSLSLSFWLCMHVRMHAEKDKNKYWSLGLAVTREVSDLFSPGWCQILRLERATRGGALFLWTHFLDSGKQNVRHCCQTTNHGVIRQFVFAFCFSPKSAHTYLCSPGWTAGDLLENSFLFLEGGIIKVTRTEKQSLLLLWQTLSSVEVFAVWQLIANLCLRPKSCDTLTMEWGIYCNDYNLLLCRVLLSFVSQWLT